jgi:hypothetical protein
MSENNFLSPRPAYFLREALDKLDKKGEPALLVDRDQNHDGIAGTGVKVSC